MQNHFSIFNFKSKRGFSLIEMIVAMGIFAIVAVVALGALMKIISANKKAQSIQTTVTNINYALDTMAREMRSGVDYYCEVNPTSLNLGISDGKSCESIESILTEDGGVIAFNSSKTKSDGADTCRIGIAYKFEYKAEIDGFRLMKSEQSDCNSSVFDNPSSILDDDVIITGYYLSVTDDIYPLATLRISGYSGVRENEKTFFDIQTAISPRVR